MKRAIRRAIAAFGAASPSVSLKREHGRIEMRWTPTHRSGPAACCGTALGLLGCGRNQELSRGTWCPPAEAAVEDVKR